MTTTAHDEAVDRAAVLDELLAERWSCRGYQDRVVETAVIERLLTMAQRSASWCNTQPWQVTVTRGEGTERFRSALMEYASSLGAGETHPDVAPLPEYHGIYQERRRECGWQLYEAVGIEHGDREGSGRQAFENFRLFGAPHVAIVTVDARHGVYGAVDGGLYLGSFLLAAQSLGLAAIPQAAIALCAPFVHEYFGIGDDRTVLAGISFGYPDHDHPANGYRTRRAALDEVVTWVES